MKNFYNTISLKGEELTEATASNERQEVRILSIFKESDEPLTPFDVQFRLEAKGFNYPITSIRRAMSDLTAAGRLVKLDEMKPGIYGKPNYCWQISAA